MDRKLTKWEDGRWRDATVEETRSYLAAQQGRLERTRQEQAEWSAAIARLRSEHRPLLHRLFDWLAGEP